MKNLILRLKTLVLDRQTWYFNSNILKYLLFHTLNLKCWVIREKYRVFRKRYDIPSLNWSLCTSYYVDFRRLLRVKVTLEVTFSTNGTKSHKASPIKNLNIRTFLSISINPTTYFWKFLVLED